MSGSGFLIDTNVLIDFFKGSESIAQQIIENNIYISSVVIGEVYYGAMASTIVSNREKRQAEISSLSGLCTVLDVGEKTARIYGTLKSKLKSKGTPIPENDIWIAATGIEYGLQIVNSDSHFSKIEELKTENW